MWESPLWREHQGYIAGTMGDWAIERLRRCGASNNAMVAAFMPGGAKCRIVTGWWEPDPAGVPMVILPVIGGIYLDEHDERQPDVVDLCAFHPDKPDDWHLRRLEYGAALGGDNLENCGDDGWSDRQIHLYQNPLTWLLAGAAGACLLRPRECRSTIIGIPRVVCESRKLALEIDDILRDGDLSWPDIQVQAA